MKKECIFCESSEIVTQKLAGRTYHLCRSCSGIFLDPECMLSPEEEKKRYELHNNTLENSGYKAYLETFMASVFSFLSASGTDIQTIHHILDYGSGPEPCLVQLLQEKGFDSRGWDPFFCTETVYFENGADMVSCLEVAEHFTNPVQAFKLMAEKIRIGGFLALGTHLVSSFPNEIEKWAFFRSWWYRQDLTHVSFYSEKSLILVAQRAGLEWLGSFGAHSYLFRKN